MWEMYEDNIECDECGGPGPPPKFMIPPPPRPPGFVDYGLVSNNCNDEEMAKKAAQNWDSDMCEALPILDASLYSSQSLQTSAIIAVFSLLLVLVVLISSLFVWKNKRKVQNFLPCKTPTRGPHMNGGLPGGHSVTYEDPDAHLGHRPLVMRHHHNVEMLHHSKGIHYPSGYPMTRSPPFLVSSSPGPDPYRSNDNVYEELGPGRDSDGESEPPLHSDDDFAEDELSLPGERSFNKSISDTASMIPVSTIYHERINASQSNNGQERNSLLSSSSSSNAHNDVTTVTSATTSVSTSSTNNNAPSSRAGGILSGVLRHTTGRQNNNRKNRHKPPAGSSSMDEFYTSEQLVGDVMVPMTQNHLYDNRSHNLMSLAYTNSSSNNNNNNANFHHHSLSSNINTNNNNNNSIMNNGSNNNRVQYYNTLENEVERRNRINNQLHHPASAVATIFRERNLVNHPNRYPQPYYAASNLLSSMRSRTNPRSIDRRRIVPPIDPIEPTYGYAEPIFNEGYLYDTCARQQHQQQLATSVGRNATPIGGSSGPLSYPEYIAPDYTSAGLMATYRTTAHHHHHHHPAAATHHHHHNHQLYSRGGSAGGGDSSFGSDSGYSHHHSSTPASSIGRGGTGSGTTGGCGVNGSSQSKLTAALNFGWNRRQTKQQQQPMAPQPAPTPKSSTSSSSSSSTTTSTPKDIDADHSPNNNTGTLDAQQSPHATIPPVPPQTPSATATNSCNSTDMVNCNTTAKA